MRDMGATASKSSTSNSVAVYHKDRNGVLHPCDRKTTDAFLAAAVQGLQLGPSDTTPKFDLKRMKELKFDMFEEEDIVIKIPWNARISRAAVSLNGDSLRKALEMALSRIRQEQSLSKILDIKRVPHCSIRENLNLVRGHLPYDNFVASLATATLASKPDESPSSGKMLFDAILETAWDPTDSNVRLLEKKGLWIVFHGTNHAVMDAILRTGLLPEFRCRRDRDWFGTSYVKSLHYTRSKTPGLLSGSQEGCKLIVFMVLHPQHYCNAVEVSSELNVYQLPLAEITLSQRTVHSIVNPNICIGRLAQPAAFNRGGIGSEILRQSE